MWDFEQVRIDGSKGDGPGRWNPTSLRCRNDDNEYKENPYMVTLDSELKESEYDENENEYNGSY